MARFKGDYKAAFEAAVSELIEEDIRDRAERMQAIDALIDEYINATGETPDAKQIERLTDYILREELFDSSPDKITREEYPILSERQLRRRRSMEVPLESVAEYIGDDGKIHRAPKRRKRTLKENLFMDEAVKSRNKERRRKYAEFTRPGPVKTYFLSERVPQK